jgi:hypothetical protein
MSRYRRNAPDYSWVFEAFFIAMGSLGFILGWPVWLCLVLLAIGGVIIIVTSDGDLGGGGWDIDW